MFLVANLIFILPKLTQSQGLRVITVGPIGLPTGVLTLIHETQMRMCVSKPIYFQYACFLKNTFASWPPYFGLSYQYYPQFASTVVLHGIAWTMLLAIPALLVSIGVSYALCATRVTSKWRLGSLGALAPVVPVYWFAMLMIWIFAFSLHWLPAFGSYLIGNVQLPSNQFLESVSIHYVLPFGTLVLVMFSVTFRSFRYGLEFETKSLYTTSSQIKEPDLSSNHIARKAAIDLLSSPVTIVGALISSDILVETVFGYRGVGFLMVGALISRDIPVIEASLFFLAAFMSVVSLSLDVVRLGLVSGEKENEARAYCGIQDAHQEITKDTPVGKEVYGGGITEAFGLLELAIAESFPDLPKGYTWSEALARLKATTIDTDWVVIETTVKKYEAFKYGGCNPQEVDTRLITELAISIARMKPIGGPDS
jgi:peptide/nickel transport system permease protein